MPDPASASSTLHSPGTSQPARPPRILFALTDLEYGLFFRPDEPALKQEGRLRYRPEEADWLGCLERFEPEVLVSGWTTPVLPVGWLEREDCPLRYVCHLTGSVRNLLPRSFIERGGQVTNWGGVAAPTVAEHALLLALMALRSQRGWSRIIRTADQIAPPTHRLQTRSLFDRRVGIHGFGKVAHELINLLRPFGVSVHAYTAGLPREIIARNGINACASLEELFSRSDILFECEALNAENAGCVTAEVLARLPDRAVFVNVGRGQLVDEEALRCESASGRIRVALDVVQDEPVNERLSFLQHESAIVSPHIAGPTADHYRRCAELAFGNLERYVSGQPLENIISLEAFDRST